MVHYFVGGIGGVHRGASESFDVSADLTELGRTPVAVISSGVRLFKKIISNANFYYSNAK